MTSTSTSHQQQPPSTDFSVHQQPHASHMDHNGQLATSGYGPNDNQLAGLVEAATAAAGQDVSEWAAAAAAAAAAGHHHLEYGADLQLGDDSFGDGGFGMGPTHGAGRHLRGSTSNAQGQGQASGLSRAVSRKRKRGEEPLDPALTAPPGDGQPHQQQQQQFDGDSLDIRELPPQQSLSEARAAGVHSAAALFRQPSSNKKYTRPPMSKLFASLELSPENFLHLQAAAKNYMLDDNHPERRDCVGQRGKGDTEMVKLRLWNCVRQFLEGEGYGERFFGEHVVNEGMPPRQYIWPRDQHKIISLVIPLLRRMVTNERQRQYAIETRKGGGSDERRRRKTEESLQNLNAASQQSPPTHEHHQSHQPIESHDPQAAHFPPAPPVPLPEMPPSNVQLDLSNLVMEGYPTDWNTVSKSYNMYNHDYQLDNLWSVSGLQQPDWWGLFAAVDSHYQVMHHGDPFECNKLCEDANVNRILSSDALVHANWRVGGTENSPARIEFASSITRDVSRIIRNNLGKRDVGGSSPQLEATNADANGIPEPPAYLEQVHQTNFGSTETTATTAATSTAADHHHHHHHSACPITLRFNILQDGKRILPRLDISAEQCPDLTSVRQFISRRYAGQLPGSGFDETTGTWDTSRWKIQVWLPEGLVPVQNDGEWTIAQLSAGTVDWMEGDLRVVIDLGESGESG